MVSGPHTTNSSGKISVTGLNAGTYYVKELGHTDSAISAQYVSAMTIRMTEHGLAEINTNKRVYASEAAVHSGYSDCTIRITYQATMHNDEI